MALIQPALFYQTLPHCNLISAKGPLWLGMVYHLVCFLPHADSKMSSSILHTKLKSALFHLANINFPLLSPLWHQIQLISTWIFLNSFLEVGFSSRICNCLENGTAGWAKAREMFCWCIVNSLLVNTGILALKWSGFQEGLIFRSLVLMTLFMTYLGLLFRKYLIHLRCSKYLYIPRQYV